MKLLILGGTVFLGRHLVEAARARGHTITLFNRGQHNPELYPELEKLHGDRDPLISSGQALAALRGRHWDAVIDTCGYMPRVVRASAELLADAVEHYTFISSISVYADFSTPGIDERAPVGTLADESVEENRRNLWAAEGAMRAGGRARAARPGAERPPWADRRPTRL